MAQRGRHTPHVPFAASVPGYDPFSVDFVAPYSALHPSRVPPGNQHGTPNRRRTFSGMPSMHRPSPAQHRPSPAQQTQSASNQNTGESTEVSNSQLLDMIRGLQDDLMEVKGENMALKQAMNTMSGRVIDLEGKLDELNQYGRRENVCFSNLKVDEEHTCEAQVINLCHEIGVEVTAEDLVAAHPLPTKGGQGRQRRYIARFHDRRKAQEVFAARKRTKEIDPVKKSALAAQSNRGIAIQPNITLPRARLLAQLKEAKERLGWDSCWVDYRTGNLMLKTSPSNRPVLIRSTFDIVKVSGNQFEPRGYHLCQPNIFDVFEVSRISVHE